MHPHSFGLFMLFVISLACRTQRVLASQDSRRKPLRSTIFACYIGQWSERIHLPVRWRCGGNTGVVPLGSYYHGVGEYTGGNEVSKRGVRWVKKLEAKEA